MRRTSGIRGRVGLAALCGAVVCSGGFWFCGQILADPPKLSVQPGPISQQTKSETSLAPVVKKAAPSVVYVYTSKTIKEVPFRSPFFDDPTFRFFFGDPREGRSERPRERQQQGLGSGVIVSEDGYVLTANHVVDGADEVKVLFAEGKKEYEAKVVGSDPPSDVAVLKIEARHLPAITITDSDNLEVGDLVIAIGNPFGVGQTVTTGIVSAKSRGGFGIVDYEDFIQTDASINPGNSGGALVDAEGRLVGINSAIISRSGGNQGIGFAVPINMARVVMERLIKDGKVTRGFLGVSIQPVTPELAKAFNLPGDSGALVGEVRPNTPAAAAGLKEGDVILAFDGKKVEDSRQLRLMVSQTPPETQVTLKIVRDGKEKTFRLALGELPANEISTRGAPGGWGGKADSLEGVQMADLDARTRRQYEIPAQVTGALVTEVDPGSGAFAAGLREGDVIVEVNRRNVDDVSDVVRAARAARSESLLLRVWGQGGSRYVVLETTKAKR